MFHVPEQFRWKRHPLVPSDESYGNNGFFIIPASAAKRRPQLAVQASDGKGWEHVSVSTPTRCPTWEEMCFIKSMFWDDEDVVIQYHPAKSDYVNMHPYCLHLWRPTQSEIPTPPSIFVGFNKSVFSETNKLI